VSGADRCSTVFDGLHIEYTQGLLTPRAWTAAQSRWAGEVSDDLPTGPVLELCAGAGHIGLAAAVRCRRPLVQVDIDPVACAFARANAKAAGREQDVTVHCTTIEAAAGLGEYPIVLADPPYLDRNEVARYPEDPVLAIDGGDDGMELIRSCLLTLAQVTDPSGMAILQVRGAHQAHAVEAEIMRRGHPLAVEGLRTFGPERALLALRRQRRPTRTQILSAVSASDES
jgi:methylase of polypeptide subunit release factors